MFLGQIAKSEIGDKENSEEAHGCEGVNCGAEAEHPFEVNGKGSGGD